MIQKSTPCSKTSMSMKSYSFSERNAVEMQTSFLETVELGQREKFAMMLRENRMLDVNFRYASHHHATALHIVCTDKKGYSKAYKKMVKMLVEDERIDLNVCDASGWTPLMVAAACGRSKVVDVLLSHEHTNINSHSHVSHETCLHLAVANGHVAVVKSLLRLGLTQRVNVWARNVRGHTALEAYVFGHPSGNDSWTSKGALLHRSVDEAKEDEVEDEIERPVRLDEAVVDIAGAQGGGGGGGDGGRRGDGRSRNGAGVPLYSAATVCAEEGDSDSASTAAVYAEGGEMYGLLAAHFDRCARDLTTQLDATSDMLPWYCHRFLLAYVMGDDPIPLLPRPNPPRGHLPHTLGPVDWDDGVGKRNGTEFEGGIAGPTPELLQLQSHSAHRYYYSDSEE